MSTPAGWYDDHHGALRWWDGAQWTDRVQPLPAAVAGDAVAPGSPAPVSVAPAPAPAVPAPSARRWILWGVIAAVVVVVVIVGAVLTPVMIGLSERAKEESTAKSRQEAAVQTVKVYDAAWGGADCAAYQRATTAALRAATGYTECAVFERDARAFRSSVQDYDLTVTDVQTFDDESIDITTSETYLSTIDGTGAPLAQPEPREDVVVYTVVRDGENWAIDGIQ